MIATWAMMPENKSCIAVAHIDCQTSQPLQKMAARDTLTPADNAVLEKLTWQQLHGCHQEQAVPLLTFGMQETKVQTALPCYQKQSVQLLAVTPSNSKNDLDKKMTHYETYHVLKVGGVHAAGEQPTPSELHVRQHGLCCRLHSCGCQAQHHIL